MSLRARSAEPADASAIARIYSEGIADRLATFETRPRTPSEVLEWIAGHPVAVACEGGEVVAFASTSAYSARACYAHIAEFSVYADRTARRRGAGTAALLHLFELCKAVGLRKLVSRVFVENAASRALLAKVGFREVGVHQRHGQLDGVWHDVVIVEKHL